jgi:hypothetical protein
MRAAFWPRSGLGATVGSPATSPAAPAPGRGCCRLLVWGRRRLDCDDGGIVARILRFIALRRHSDLFRRLLSSRTSRQEVGIGFERFCLPQRLLIELFFIGRDVGLHRIALGWACALQFS